MSTAVEQAVACAPVTERTRVLSAVGTSFLGGVFPGFSSFVRHVGKLQAYKIPEYHLTVIIIFPIRLVRMSGCADGVYRLSCLCCLGGGPGIEVIPHPGRPSMSLCGQKTMCVIQSKLPLPTGRSSVRSGWRKPHNGTYKGQVKLRYWMIMMMMMITIINIESQVETRRASCAPTLTSQIQRTQSRTEWMENSWQREKTELLSWRGTCRHIVLTHTKKWAGGLSSHYKYLQSHQNFCSICLSINNKFYLLYLVNGFVSHKLMMMNILVYPIPYWCFYMTHVTRAYRATTCWERELTLDHTHTFLTTQGLGGPRRMREQFNAGATSEATRT